MANNINDIFKDIRTSTGSYNPPNIQSLDDRFDIYFGDLILVSLSFWLIFKTFFSGMSRIIGGDVNVNTNDFTPKSTGNNVPRYSNSNLNISSPRIKR